MEASTLLTAVHMNLVSSTCLQVKGTCGRSQPLFA